MKDTIKSYSKIACVASGICLIGAAAYASTDKAEIQKEFHATFERMLTHPADLDLTMRYAELAMKLEDYEAAVPALERMLMFNPNLPETKLQLGILYYKLDSFDVAKAYLMDAKKSKNVSKELIAEANHYLKKI